MAKQTYQRSNRPGRRDDAAKRASSIQKRADEEFYDRDYSEFDYDRSVKFANRGCLAAIAVVIIAVAIVLLILFLSVSREINGKNSTVDGVVTVQVPSGAGGEIVGGKLEEAGVIGNGFIFRLYSRFGGPGGSFRSGSYELTGGMSYDELLDMMTTKQESRETTKITFVDGATVWQFGEACEKAGVCTAQEFVDAANNIEDFKDIKFLEYITFDPDTYMKAEGYLAPNTFDIYVDESPTSIAYRLYKQMNTVLETMTFETSEGTKTFYEQLERQAAQMPEGYTFGVREALTLASLVEEEASKHDKNQAAVAGVFWNRLTRDLSGTGLADRTLGTDASVYYLEDTISRDYTLGDINSVPKKYRDAYLRLDDGSTPTGLPVGPLSNSNIYALEAALQPQRHDYFYFVTDLYGEYYYGRNYAEHEANIAKADAMNEQWHAENPGG